MSTVFEQIAASLQDEELFGQLVPFGIGQTKSLMTVPKVIPAGNCKPTQAVVFRQEKQVAKPVVNEFFNVEVEEKEEGDVKIRIVRQTYKKSCSFNITEIDSLEQSMSF